MYMSAYSCECLCVDVWMHVWVYGCMDACECLCWCMDACLYLGICLFGYFSEDPLLTGVVT